MLSPFGRGNNKELDYQLIGVMFTGKLQLTVWPASPRVLPLFQLLVQYKATW